MKTITLEDMTQEAFDAAAETVVSGIKAYNRKLDTRDGTVLRDLLVNPEAAIEGVISGQIEEARKSSSLKRLQEAQESGEEIDQEDVDAILSNFNIKPHSGTNARGLVKVVVSDGTVAYSVSEGDVFSTVEGAEFTADHQVIASTGETPNPAITITAKLYKGAAGYFFLVPVTASDYGSSYNIAQGTSLEMESPVQSFVMAEAYKDFDGGSDVETISETIASIPSGLSIRGFVNKTAVEGMLRDEYDAGEYPIVAVSAVGYGNKAQIRDRHNVCGVGVRGRVDVYVRNFTNFFTLTKTVKGVLTGDGRYRIDVGTGVFPGACWIKSVSDPFSSSDGEDVLSSLAFEAKRTDDVSGTWHDFDCAKSPVEAFNTVWQGFELYLENVPPDSGASDSSSSNDSWSDERDFKVTAYCLPLAGEIQAYVDRDDIRSVSTDVVVRCPVICNVSVNANVQYDPKNPIDEATAKAKIRTYINGLGFVGRLTRSEIVQILKNLGAVSVDMPTQDMLYGELHDAAGVRHTLSGDALDVSAIENGPVMLTKDTMVFCADDDNIQIKLTPNS